jgi:hypothetical protein
VGKPERKRPLHRRGWKDNNKMDLKVVGRRGMDWIHMVQGSDKRRALANTAMKLGCKFLATSPFNIVSPCHPPIEGDTKIHCIIYKGNVPSV